MMKGGIAGLMKQAQQMQANMEKAQEQLAQIEVEGQSGAGAVKVEFVYRDLEGANPEKAKALAQELVVLDDHLDGLAGHLLAVLRHPQLDRGVDLAASAGLLAGHRQDDTDLQGVALCLGQAAA